MNCYYIVFSIFVEEIIKYILNLHCIMPINITVNLKLGNCKRQFLLFATTQMHLVTKTKHVSLFQKIVDYVHFIRLPANSVKLFFI